MPRNKDDGGDEGKGISLSNAASRSERNAKGGAKFYGALSVGVKVVPGFSQLGWEPDVREKAHSEVWLEAVEEFVVVVRSHGGIKAVED